MIQRSRAVGAASAALVAALMVATPSGAYAAPPAQPDGPDLKTPQVFEDLQNPSAGKTKDVYLPKGEEGFQKGDAAKTSKKAADKLGTADTRMLQKAQAADEETVTVLILAGKGATKDVVAAVRKAGGTVGTVEDEVGYVRAVVPTDSVPGLAALPIVKAIDLDRTYKVPAPDLGTGAKVKSLAAGPQAPGAGTPADNAYLPIGETGALDFIEKNPDWDGRGTVVGVLDTGVDIDHPALQKTSDGKPKIVDWVTATHPILDRDGSWVRMQREVSGPSFSYGGKTWKAPEGDFQIAWFYESVTAPSDFGGDLNHDGDDTDSFAVLYQPSTHRVWVDTDGDNDFTDAPGMLPYAQEQQIGHFGADDAATAVNESVPFVVEYRDGVDLSPLGGNNVGKTGNYVNIGLSVASHATHVAGIIAGTSMLGGEMHGAAPGAQIVSARACTWGGGCTSSALTEGMIDLVVNRGVDVVNLSVGGLPALNDGSDVIAMLYDQLIDQYGVQIIISAGNDGLGTNTVSSPSVASRAISVAASVSSATWWADYGSKVDTKEGIFGFSSRGPAENGAFAPQVAAPGAAVSSTPMWMPGSAVPEAGYALPVGYSMQNGTSMAAPQVAGSAALLLSAAKAKKLEVGPDALRTALVGTARLIPDVPTTAQGAGVIDTVAAWKQISAKVAVSDLTVSAPVCTSLSGHLAKADSGPGVYNRCLPDAGGQVTGADKTYTVDVTRTSGAAGSVNHRIGWIGNDGTFSARAALPLKKDKAATVSITANAKTSGVHSAIMTIDDPATTGIDQFVPVTVLSTKALTVPGFAATVSGTVPKAGTTSLLVPVPEGVEALQLTLDDVADGSQVRVLPIDPDGMPADSNASSHCFTNYNDPAKCDAQARAVNRPKAGIWEFVIEARRTSPVEANTFRASVALQGMSFAPAALEIDSAVVNEKTALATTSKNAFGSMTAHVAGGDLGSQLDLYSTVADGEETLNRVDVPRQSSRLDLTITPRDAASDVDFYVVYGATGEVLAQATTMGAGVERVVMDKPRPGTYYVVVVGVDSPSGSTTFDYHEEMFAAGFGRISATSDAAVELKPGQTLPVDATMVIATQQLRSYQPVIGRLAVANSHGTVVGAARVAVKTVTMPKLEVQKWEKPFVGAVLTDDGKVGGDRQFNSLMTPTVWTAEDGFVDRQLVGGKEGSVLDMNEDGASAGLFYKGGNIRPALWQADGTMSEVTLPEGRAYTDGYGTGIGSDGAVIAFADATEGSGPATKRFREGFLRASDGTTTLLPHLSERPELTQPRAITDSDVIVGDSLTAQGYSHAVMWTDGKVSDLGVLDGQYTSEALDVNASGTVVGVSGDDAFTWTAAKGMTRLADYGFNATAEDITDDGWILGTVELAPEYEVSAMWDPQGRLWDISGMVPMGEDEFFLPIYSFGINNQHQLMVYGYGGPAGADSSTVLLGIPENLGR
ncbi:MAG: S8 family serine peptidase [Microbacterium sp.]|jgi:probable HAF family extracellular repeat protein|nr:S8 family serine peptidase [Microbacterium sp.]